MVLREERELAHGHVGQLVQAAQEEVHGRGLPPQNDRPCARLALVPARVLLVAGDQTAELLRLGFRRGGVAIGSLELQVGHDHGLRGQPRVLSTGRYRLWLVLLTGTHLLLDALRAEPAREESCFRLLWRGLPLCLVGQQFEHDPLIAAVDAQNMAAFQAQAQELVVRGVVASQGPSNNSSSGSVYPNPQGLLDGLHPEMGQTAEGFPTSCATMLQIIVKALESGNEDAIGNALRRVHDALKEALLGRGVHDCPKGLRNRFGIRAARDDQGLGGYAHVTLHH
mmetsp:Transcript_80161/g.201695  ORF Transcript_80161/g.201695 Transcript_80161/m.201695 type:complete len:282 (+) Transcript_80161:542-1387(+)